MTTISRTATISLLLTGAVISAPLEVAAEPPEFPDEEFEDLNYGLYWFGAKGEYQKHEDEESNPHFDPDKKTLIYIHGWQNGLTQERRREAFDWVDDKGPDEYLAEAWIADGWNVGVVYWNQFADEKRIAHAEAKIRSTDGPMQMRWRDADGNYHDDGLDVSVGEMAYQQYTEAMKGYSGEEIRIAGQGLGAQVALDLSRRLADNHGSGEVDPELLPRRVVLLDPYFGIDTPDDSGSEASAAAVALEDLQAAKQANAEIIVELHRSTAVPSGGASTLFGDPSPDLARETAMVTWLPAFHRYTQREDRRFMASTWLYFKSYQDDPPSVGVAASTSEADARAAMEGADQFEQTQGRFTLLTADDRFIAKPR